jgi:ABC-type transport system involved in cytochrome c biogenesis permease component
VRAPALVWMKDIREMLLSWQASLWLVAGSLLFSLGSYLILTNTGVTLLTQSEALWAVTKLVVLVGLLATITDASASLASEFESGTADGLLVGPMRLGDLVLAKVALAFTLWALLLLISIPYVLSVASGTGVSISALVYTGLTGTLAVGCLVMPVVALSLLFRSVKSTLITSMVVFLGFSLPALFSSTLSVGGLGNAIKRVDPVQNAFAILDNVIVDTNTALGSNLNDLAALVVWLVAATGVLAAVVWRTERGGVS